MNNNLYDMIFKRKSFHLFRNIGNEKIQLINEENISDLAEDLFLNMEVCIMSYPKTGNEVFVSFSLSNTMLSGIGKGTITREDVSADYLKDLFQKYGVIVSAKPEQRRLLERGNEIYDLGLDIPASLRIIQLSEKNRRLVVISVQGLRRHNGSLLPEYTEEEFQEATFSFVKYYVQSKHYDDLVEENKKLKKELESEVNWRNRVSDI